MPAVLNDGDASARIAAAIGEPARARMLYCLLDNRARTGTELAVVAGVAPSTASVHLSRLQTEGLLKVHKQGRHRYYSLDSPDVAAVLEALNVVAGNPRARFEPNTPQRLRAARTCYDHLAGTLAVQLHDRLRSERWLTHDYKLTAQGVDHLSKLNIDIDGVQSTRRRFAYPCLDWSERRYHLGGALGSALLQFVLKKRWLLQDLDSRALTVTKLGAREFANRFSITSKHYDP